MGGNEAVNQTLGGLRQRLPTSGGREGGGGGRVTLILVAWGSEQSSNRMVYPTSCPNRAPRSSATRLAT